MYVCHCQVVNDRRIREEIEAGAITPRQVAERCGAGATCAGCLPAIRRLLMEQGARPCECPCPLAAAVVRAKLAAAAVTTPPAPVAQPAATPLAQPA
jgi:bacterioferritin-associated ferredoxin